MWNQAKMVSKNIAKSSEVTVVGQIPALEATSIMTCWSTIGDILVSDILITVDVGVWLRVCLPSEPNEMLSPTLSDLVPSSLQF